MKIPSNAYPIAIALCKEFEGFAAAAYKFPGETWYTIGYGTVQIDDRPVPPGMVISEPEAAALLEAELRRRGDRLADIVRHPLNANQWAALLSLAYNVKGGVGVSQAAIRKGSASTLGSQTIQKERSIRIQPRDPRRR